MATETQTHATRNEAADRLRDEYGDEGYFGPMLDTALAAERRATVERIRERIYGPPSVESARQFYARVRSVLADEEAEAR
jgi:broad specificity phosphatase PhoE